MHWLRRTFLAWSLMTSALAQQSVAGQPDAAALVRAAIENEIKASKDDAAHFMFRSTKSSPKGSITRVYIEAKEATAGLTVAYDGKPLTPEQRQAEELRIDRFIKNPDDLRKKHKQEQDNRERTLRVLRAIPDAFLFDYAGEQPASPGVGKPGEMLTVLKFHPNPNYQPPTRVEQVLPGMEGTILLDPEQKRLASIDGTLFKDVSFGWGILGHLDKGGHFLVQQQAIRDSYWYLSRMELRFTGKIMMVKNLSIDTTELFTHVKLMPSGITFAEAIAMLKKEEPVVAQESNPKN